MWRMPIMNLGFVLVVITILGLRHSNSVFSRAETAYRATAFDVSGQELFGSPVGDRFETSGNYLSNLWRRSVILKQWLLESQTNSWERLRLSPGAEFDFVEARIHVANAEVFGAAMGDRQRAKIELDRADGYLQHALPTINRDLQFVVKAIRTKVTDAKFELDLGYPNPDNNDEQIKTDLDWLIRTVNSSPL